MAKQDQTIKNNNINKTSGQPGIKTDLINFLIGMVVMILFIVGLVYGIGALLK